MTVDDLSKLLEMIGSFGFGAVIGGILVWLFLKSFLPSYLTEKGKNLATREDIGEITSEIESIKSSIHFSLESRLSWRQEEHNSLVDYYSKFGLWLSSISDTTAVYVSEENIDQLAESRAELDSLNRDFESANNRMQLFVENAEILTQTLPLKIKVLEFDGHAKQFTYEIEKLSLDIKLMRATTPHDRQIEQFRELLEKKRNLFKNFKAEQLQLYKEIQPLFLEHRHTISSHLRNLINTN